MSDEMEEWQSLADKLDTMSRIIGRWIEWGREHREREHLTTENGTNIMALPVPLWPTHGQMRAWIETLDEAKAALSPAEGGSPPSTAMREGEA